MREKNEMPDRGPSESASAEACERLRGIERRLQGARPRPASLGADAWEQIQAALPGPAATGPQVVSLAGPASPANRRSSGWFLTTIAAAWLIGVAVGSFAMFLAMRAERELQTASDQEKMVVPAEQARSIEPSTAVPVTSLEDALNGDAHDVASDRAVSPSPMKPTAWLVASHDSAWLAHDRWPPDAPLGARGIEQLLRPRVMAGATNSPSWDAERTLLSESQRELARSFVPTPAATPRRILNELQGDAARLW